MSEFTHVTVLWYRDYLIGWQAGDIFTYSDFRNRCIYSRSWRNVIPNLKKPRNNLVIMFCSTTGKVVYIHEDEI